MTIKVAKTAPRDGISTQNGRPENVPYVYRQQQRRNTYAARIAQRNAQESGLSPAVADDRDETLSEASRLEARPEVSGEAIAATSPARWLR
jgi:hypothetical protein